MTHRDETFGDEKWNLRFLALSKHVSQWSLDPSTRVGAVITDNKNRVISLGYNGFPRGILDDARLEDRDQKYAIVLHAEQNAILFAKRNLDECIMYTYPFMPCSTCAALIIQAGITRVVSVTNNNLRWQDNFKLSESILYEAGVICQFYNPELLV